MSVSDIRVWVNGQGRVEGPAIDALDHGVTVGDAVFETAKIVDGQVFARRRHHERLDRSLAGLGLGPADRAVLDEGIAAVLDGEPIAHGRLRYSVTAGPGPLGSDRLDGAMTTIVLAGGLPRPEPTTTVAVVPWVRNERAATTGVKSTSYAENVVALAAAKRLGGTEAILANTRGQLCEGTGSNIFVVLDGHVYTPAMSTGPLAGITRELVLEWGSLAGLPVVEAELDLSVLEQAQEVFLTSSTRDIQPVTAIEVVDAVDTTAGRLDAAPVRARRDLPGPGPITADLMEVFAKRSGADLDP